MKHKSLWVPVLLILALALIGCTAAQTSAPTATKTSSAPSQAATTAPAPTQAAPTPTPAPKIKYGGTLKWAVNSDIYGTGVDPACPAGCNTLNGTGQGARQIFNGLIQFEPETGNLLPELATEWTVSSDGKEMIFKLRPGVKFQDGTPFNAEAVKYHFDRLMGFLDPKKVGRFAPGFMQLARVDAVDDLTVKFVLKGPQLSILTFLADPGGWISSPTAVKKFGDQYTRNVVGTGPYVLKEWTKDTRMVLEKFADYWEKDKDGNKYPYLDSIVFTPITETTTQMANVRSGSMDIADEVPPEMVATVKADPNVVYYEKPGIGMDTIYLQYNKPPFDNWACAEAFLGAIDKAAISKSVYMGIHPPAETVISPANANFDSATKGLPFDLNRAKQKLAECGKPDGFEVTFDTPSVPRIVNRMEAIQGQVAKIGIKLNLSVADMTTTIKAVVVDQKNNGFALFEGSSTDPILYLAKGLCGKSTNFLNLCVQEFDKAVNDVESAPDLNQRKVAWQKLAILNSYKPWMVPLVFNPQTMIATKKVKGVRMLPQLNQQAKWVWME